MVFLIQDDGQRITAEHRTATPPEEQKNKNKKASFFLVFYLKYILIFVAIRILIAG